MSLRWLTWTTLPLLGACALTVPAGAVSAPDPRVRATPPHVAHGRSLVFEANEAQADPAVRFLARGPGYTLLLTPTEAILALPQPVAAERPRGRAERLAAVPPSPPPTLVRMSLRGANPDARVTGLAEQRGKVNYFRGNDPARWRTSIPTYARVEVQDVYPGVSLVYYGGGPRQLEYDFVVAPGADPSVIRLAFQGVEPPALDGGGHVLLRVPGGALTVHRPVVYQEIGGQRIPVEARFVLDGGSVGVSVAAYDRSRPLVVDPVIHYSTYLGGSGNEEAEGVAVDAALNAYVAGFTASVDFPVTAGAFDMVFNGGNDAFVTKYDVNGTQVYSTYLGGSGNDIGSSIAVDASTGEAFVAGFTASANFPTTVGAFQTVFGGVLDAFVTKLSPTGAGLVYSTYLGGGGTDAAFGIGIDTAGNAYVTGRTTGGFPTTLGAFQPVYGGGGADAYVTKLNPTGTGLVYSTYLGGPGNDIANGIAVDAAGQAYVAGSSGALGFPTTVGAFQTAFQGVIDAFVSKLNAAGSALVYSTYLGGSGNDQAAGIAVNAAGQAHVTGITSSASFPTLNPIQGTFAGGPFDAFATKLNAAGSALVFSTYLGGSVDDAGNGIAVDPAGFVYVAGDTTSLDFTSASPACTGDDAFFVKLDDVGVLVISGCIGGTGGDAADAIAVDRFGNAYLVGDTSSGDFPTVNPFQPSPGGGVLDAFIVKLATAANLALGKAGPPTATVGVPFTYVLTVANNGGLDATGVTLTDTLPAAVALVSAIPSQGSCSGTTTVTCMIGSLLLGASATITITVTPTSAGTVTNTATVAGAEPDSDLADNTAMATTTVSAPPAPATVILTLIKAGSGTGTVTVAPVGVACDAVCVSISLRLAGGGTATLTATPTPGTIFLRWSLPACGAANPCVVPLVADTTVVATFDRLIALATGAGPGGGPHVRGFDAAGAPTGPGFQAYGTAFTGGVFVALGPVDGSGIPRLVTGTGAGGGPHVQVLDGDGVALASFMAYDPAFRGGVRVATGDVNGDGRADIITGAGPGGAAHVRVFSLASGSPVEIAGFIAYDPGFRGGVWVAAADVDGDGRADVITGADAGGGSHVRAFSLASGSPVEIASFLAFDPSFTGGVRVAAGDVDGDGRADIIVGAGPGSPAVVRVRSGATGADLAAFVAYPASFTGGVFVASGRLDGSGRADIVTGPGAGWSPHVRAFTPALVERASFLAYDGSFFGGTTVAASP